MPGMSLPPSPAQPQHTLSFGIPATSLPACTRGKNHLKVLFVYFLLTSTHGAARTHAAPHARPPGKSN